MLLRRITQHVKEQNWTAVVLDFAIVLIGVLLAIQLSNWNDRRIERDVSQQFTNRLVDDLMFDAWAYERHVEYFGDVLANADRAVAALEGRQDRSDTELLISAFRATQYIAIGSTKETFEELVSSGKLDLIMDDELKQTTRLVYSAGYAEDRREHKFDRARNSPYREAFRRLVPAHIQFELNRACGDRIVDLFDYEAIVGSLDYPCAPELDKSDVRTAVTLLREDPQVLPLLRQQLMDLITTRHELEVMDSHVRQALRDHVGKYTENAQPGEN